jgi:DNA-binding response OmpR family regulator
MIGCCPSCGASLTAFASFAVGRLFVDKGGAVIWWNERPVQLTASERLIVIALARADGVPVKRDILAEVAGSESDNPDNCVDVLLCRAKAKFRAIDPNFDRIETIHGQGIRWRP